MQNRISLTCNNCGGNATFNTETDIIQCPFCGSSEIIVQSDDVKIEHIRSTNLKNYQEFELEKEKIKNERLKSQQSSDNKMIFGLLLFGFILIILFPFIT